MRVIAAILILAAIGCGLGLIRDGWLFFTTTPIQTLIGGAVLIIIAFVLMLLGYEFGRERS